MRILYLIESLGVGGTEQGLVRMLRHLDRTRFQPEVAILWGPETLGPELEAMSVPIHRLRARSGPGALLVIPLLVRLLRDGGFDVIHIALAWSSIIGPVAGRLAGKRVVVHVVNVDPEGRAFGSMSRSVAVKTRVVQALTEVIWRTSVDRFISVSEAAVTLSHGRALRDRSKVSIVRRGQDLGDLEEASRREVAPPIPVFGAPALLAVGRLQPQKGQRFLIEAMATIRRRHPDVRLLIAGEGSERDGLESLCSREGVDDIVEFLGLRRDVPALLRRSDVFVLPSLWEGNPNVMIEAMALGCSVVASDIPQIRESLVDGVSGVLVRPGDPVALAAGILRLLALLDHGDGLATAAKAVVRERYDIRKTSRVLEGAYDSLV
jgi:glycosyltransferase involved in cell wall biosynthesis